ncbi:hypothetical protein G3485_17385 [Shewanella baltica]|uniref:hypothetical protein n=1 Tax=Shewanella baltica TaxID=62322 RepID=UPI00217CEDF5|nr:hypothetical protein [Shewanella baltica]MCS6128893.1 hypothetical protein [Shewanella baltica]MCS6140823.1 hypothetical protein [Shewanella baltica]MCS6147107.1 hypothetical protein [Shewanella baltica]MCS6171636.1 hypothetical protein [Shewanella baltica]MCS6188861.1 hypothetical protein [Shewanella baltica]
MLIASFEGVQRLNPHPKWSQAPFFISQAERYLEIAQSHIDRGRFKVAAQFHDVASSYLSLAKDAEQRGRTCN